MYDLYQPFYNQRPIGILPQQQITQVNGKASVDTIQLAPNSSMLVMDTSAPIVWMCVSDGVGRVTSTPYDISIHKDDPPVNMQSIEDRIAAIEAQIARMEGDANVKPDATESKHGKNRANGIPD